jgi:hypothetical protein
MEGPYFQIYEPECEYNQTLKTWELKMSEQSGEIKDYYNGPYPYLTTIYHGKAVGFMVVPCGGLIATGPSKQKMLTFIKDLFQNILWNEDVFDIYLKNSRCKYQVYIELLK